MSGLPTPSAVSDVWPRAGGSTSAGPIPFGGGPTGLPTINNPNLPSNITAGTGPPPIPQPPITPFPTIRQSLGPSNTLTSNIYGTANTFPSVNPMAPNPVQNAQNAAYQRRLIQLEDENTQRRNATANLTQMGTQLLIGQMDVQEQVLQYQFMLEQCMETLDHQNSVLNEQAEDLALLRAKMRHFEYIMDAFKFSKEGGSLLRSMSGDFPDGSLCGDPLALPAPSTSPFFAGGPTRVTASTFQPFNPRYRSPNTRATAAGNLNQRRSVTPSITNRNLPTSNERPSRRLGNI